MRPPVGGLVGARPYSFVLAALDAQSPARHRVARARRPRAGVAGRRAELRRARRLAAASRPRLRGGVALLLRRATPASRSGGAARARPLSRGARPAPRRRRADGGGALLRRRSEGGRRR